MYSPPNPLSAEAKRGLYSSANQRIPPLYEVERGIKGEST